MIRQFMLALLCVGLAASAGAQKRSKRPAAELEENLAKVNASIDVTRQRIKSQRETQFAPDLFFMLAEMLQDKASLSASLKAEKHPNVPAGELDFNAEKRLSQEAIETYKLIEDRYPQYGAMDRVLYTIGVQSKALADDKTALSYFKKVAEGFPQSPYAVKAWIEIGESFFQKKDYEYALQQFRQAMGKAQGADLALANHKAGQSLIHMDQWLASLQHFEKAFRASEADFAEGTDIREDALIASVWPLLELSTADLMKHPAAARPLDYYRQAAGDKARYRRVLARLIQRFELKKRPQDAAIAALELLRLSDDWKEKKSAFETAYTRLKEKKTPDFPAWLGAELRELVGWMKRQKDAETKKETAKYEVVFRDIVTIMNQNALVTKRQEDLKSVAQAYEHYLASYPRTKNAPKMALNQAEALFQAGDYAQAGIKYHQLSLKYKISSAKRRKEVYDSALEGFLKSLSEPRMTALDKLQGRDGYRELAALSIKLSPRDSAVPTLLFNVARTYYDEQRFDEAADHLWKFVQAHPQSEHAKSASLLYLDCYYLRDQMKEMAAAAQRLAQLPRLRDDARIAARTAANQAQMKALRSVAGDFGTKDYAAKFREFAKKNKNSSAGEQALYEAYASFKAQSSPQVFEVGEEYVGAHEKNPRAKEVLAGLVQTAMTLLDYQRAASYMGTFAQRYPGDPASAPFAKQAAMIYEVMGDSSQALAAYELAGDRPAALKGLMRSGEWSKLNQLASSVSGLPGQYYQGLSMMRLGKTDAGLNLLQRVASASGGSAEEKEMVGHAAIIVAESGLDAFRSQGQGQAFSAAQLQAKAQAYQALSQQLQSAVNSGGGRWVVAGLAHQARLNQDFADYLKSVAPPAGMAPEQLRKLLAPQVQGYETTARETGESCAKIAEDNEIPTGYVRACRQSIRIAEKDELGQWPRGSRAPANDPADLAAAVKKDPRSGTVLRQLAQYHMRSGQAPRAMLVLSRAAELEPNESGNDSLMGVAYLLANQNGEAQAYFQQALQKDPSDPLALRGLGGLAKHFGFANKAKQYLAKSPGSVPGSELHPWLR